MTIETIDHDYTARFILYSVIISQREGPKQRRLLSLFTYTNFSEIRDMCLRQLKRNRRRNSAFSIFDWHAKTRYVMPSKIRNHRHQLNPINTDK